MSPNRRAATALFDINAFRAEYDERKQVFESLAKEVEFILRQVISGKNIKIHEIETRVKKPDSIITKCTSRDIKEPFKQLVDIIGARVICLFRSNLDDIDLLIKENFSVSSIDNKIENSSDSFGYMSVHYICRLREDFKGARYDHLKELDIEIQVRTLCMHAWAAISHYIDYKGDWDVPERLRKSLNALSGLFYV